MHNVLRWPFREELNHKRILLPLVCRAKSEKKMSMRKLGPAARLAICSTRFFVPVQNAMCRLCKDSKSLLMFVYFTLNPTG